MHQDLPAAPPDVIWGEKPSQTSGGVGQGEDSVTHPGLGGHSQSTSKERLVLLLGTKSDTEMKRQNPACDRPELSFRICGS